MAKFSGKIGFVKTVQDPEDPSRWRDEIIERQMYGDVSRSSRRWSPDSEKVNYNLNVSNQISVVADTFMYENFSCMKYVVYMGAKWWIKDVEINRPRIIITIGDVYNGESQGTT